MYNMAAAMGKVHIGINCKNIIFICPLSVLTLKMETIGGNVTGSVLKKVCADRSCFNSIKNKETTWSKITFNTYFFFAISDAVFSGAFPRACWAITEDVK